MARPMTMASVTLLAAAASGFLPMAAAYLSPVPSPFSPMAPGLPLQGSPPPPNTTLMIRPSTEPGTIGPVANVGPTGRTLTPSTPAILSQSSPVSPLKILNVSSSGIVSFKVSGDSYSTYLVVANVSGCAQSVTMSLLLQDRQGEESKSAQIVMPKGQTFSIKPYEIVVQPIRIQFAAAQETSSSAPLLPASGLLRIQPEVQNEHGCELKAENTPCRPMTDPGSIDQAVVILEPPLPSARRVGWILCITLLVSATVVAITAFSLSNKKIPLFHVMGSPTWAFGQSWGANVTIGAGLLATFATLITFPDHPRILDQHSYSVLQVLLTAVVALAPLVYGLFGREVLATTNGMGTMDSQGYVVMFLLAGGLVLWGAIGQLTALGVLICEYILGKSLSCLAGAVLEGLVGFLWILVIVYSLRTLYGTAKRLSASPAEAAGNQPTQLPLAGMPLPEPLAATLKPPMPSWSFL
jgi:hypothetical protein